MRIILASKSPRRKELMDLAEFNYEILPSNAEEVWDDDLTVEENSKNLGYQKAKSVFDNTQGDRAVVGSDTIVVLDGEHLRKTKKQRRCYSYFKKIAGKKT